MHTLTLSTLQTSAENEEHALNPEDHISLESALEGLSDLTEFSICFRDVIISLSLTQSQREVSNFSNSGFFMTKIIINYNNITKTISKYYNEIKYLHEFLILFHIKM